MIDDKSSIKVLSDTEFLYEILQQALSMHQSNNSAAACSGYQRVLIFSPSHADSMHYLGLLLSQNYEPATGIRLISRAIAIRPNDLQFYHNHALVMQKMGRYSEAVTSWTQCVGLAPHRDDLLSALSAALMITGELTQALITSRAALCLEPSSEINYIHCAVGCRELQIYDLSLKYWQFVIKINDKSYQGYIEIIKILHRLKLQPNLIIAIVQAITLLPEIGEFYVWLRKIAFEMNFILLAKSAHRSLSYFIEDLSQYVVWSGRLSQTIGESEASIDHFKVGVAISPHEAAPYYDLSFSIFKYSQIDKGVIVLSHAQTLSKDFILESPHKQWLGEAGKGRILLLYCSEEMKRAAIQFLRYVPYASARGWKIILLVPQTIFTLCQALDHVEEVITYQDRLPSFDCSASFSDLPRIFRARNDTIPSSLPFVKLSDDKNRFWSETLSTLTQHQDPSAPKIGYLIQSDLEDESPYRHSILPELFKPIVNYHPYQFYPLHFEPSLSPLNLSSKLTDYLELTAFLNQLDLFITVESHAAILAASLGKPTWLLEPFDQHWQWMVEPTQPENMQKSPWYPSVRFYRQTIQGDWSHPLSLIQENLMDFKNSL